MGYNALYTNKQKKNWPVISVSLDSYRFPGWPDVMGEVKSEPCEDFRIFTWENSNLDSSFHALKSLNDVCEGSSYHLHVL